MPGIRKHRRVIKRLETEFYSEGLHFRGISSDLSEKGLFVRTSKPFSPNTMIDLTVHLPGNTVAKLRGMVRWATKMGLISEKDGMGIEIIQSDQNFARFLNALLLSAERIQNIENKTAKPAQAVAESKPAAPPKSKPATRPKNEENSENDEIDSLISSMFFKRDKK